MSDYNKLVLDVIEREQEIDELFKKIAESTNEEVEFELQKNGDLAFATEYKGKDVHGRVSKEEVFLEYANMKDPEPQDLIDIIEHLIKAKMIEHVKNRFQH